MTIIAIVVIVLVRRKRKVEEKKRYSVIERENENVPGSWIGSIHTLSSLSINPFESTLTIILNTTQRPEVKLHVTMKARAILESLAL